MHKSMLFLAVLYLVAPSLGIADANSDIQRLERQFNDAYAANNLDKYFSFYTDDAVFWFPEGRTDTASYKKEWGEFLAGGGAIKAGKISDMHIKFSPKGDVAIASYVLHLTQQETDKKVHTDDFQESDIWFKLADGWKIAHVHYSAAPAPVPVKH
jgi:ketosteroid isomerase-like protein